jgi:hypothetical protein
MRFGNEASKRLKDLIVRLRHPEPHGHLFRSQAEVSAKLPKIPGHPRPCLPRMQGGILAMRSQSQIFFQPRFEPGLFLAEPDSFTSLLANQSMML